MALFCVLICFNEFKKSVGRCVMEFKDLRLIDTKKFAAAVPLFILKIPIDSTYEKIQIFIDNECRTTEVRL